MRLARELERHHAVFESIWSMSRIRFSKKVPTAGVYFNKKGECVDFVVNFDFWESLSFHQKCFVISHECMHVTLNHGMRSINFGRSKLLHTMANYAQDIVINHALVNRYGFDRSEIDPPTEEYPNGGYCWVETVFPDEEVPDDQNFEFYYNKLMEMIKEKFEAMSKNVKLVDEHGKPSEGEGSGEGSGEGAGEGEGKGENDEEGQGQGQGEGEGEELDKDDYNFFDAGEDFTDVLDKLNGDMNDNDKDTLKKFVEDNEDSNGQTKGGKGQVGARGTEGGTSWTFANKLEKKKKKNKFESIVTSWAKKKLVPEYKVVDQWVHTDRRFACVDSNLILPTEYETYDKIKSDIIDVWFYQDTSGSCSGYTDRFFSIAEQMPLERFNMRMFCFDTSVYETTLESRKLYGFGGTDFDILEEHIQEEMKKDPKLKYPEAVFVVTDGYGNNIQPQFPKNWHWMLTPDATKNCIPDTCNFYNLTDYE